MKSVTETFGSMVFDDRMMKATLSAKDYNSLRIELTDFKEERP